MRVWCSRGRLESAVAGAASSRARGGSSARHPSRAGGEVTRAGAPAPAGTLGEWYRGKLLLGYSNSDSVGLQGLQEQREQGEVHGQEDVRGNFVELGLGRVILKRL
jgi:hypothetical protein